MKKFISLFILTLLISSMSSIDAQHRYKRKANSDFGLGVKGGVNYANQSTSSDLTSVDVKSIFRFNGGIYCNYFFLDFLAVQPEIMLSGKGLHWTDPYYTAEDLLTYIDVPLMIKYQPVKLVNIQVGPEFSYLLRAKQKNLDLGQENNIMDYYKKFDTGLAFGIEANLPLNINITFRYVLGLNSVYTGTENQEKWKNNFFQISAGYRILGK